MGRPIRVWAIYVWGRTASTKNKRDGRVEYDAPRACLSKMHVSLHFTRFTLLKGVSCAFRVWGDLRRDGVKAGRGPGRGFLG